MCPRDAGHETRPLQTIVVPHIGGADPGQGPLDGTEVFVRGVRLLRNVRRPTLTVFQPALAKCNCTVKRSFGCKSLLKSIAMR